MTISLTQPGAMEAPHAEYLTPVPLEHLPVSELPEKSEIHRRKPPTDTDIELRMQGIIDNLHEGILAPVEAWSSLETVRNTVTYPDEHIPSSLSTARRHIVEAHARAKILGSIPKTDRLYGPMHFDTKASIKNAKGLISRQSTISYTGIIPLMQGSLYRQGGGTRSPYVIVHSIDTELLSRHVGALETAFRNQDQKQIDALNLAVGESTEYKEETHENEYHETAAAAFAALKDAKDLTAEDRAEVLQHIRIAAETALRVYHVGDIDSSTLEIASCRLLYATVLHDLAAAGVAETTETGNRAARLNAIELMWQATGSLKDYLDPKMELLRQPLKPIDEAHYTTDELRALRQALLSVDECLLGRKIRSELEYLRGIYSEELGLDPNVHQELDPENRRHLGGTALQLAVKVSEVA